MGDGYPWYQAAASAELEQGDILRACPVLVAVFDSTTPIVGASIAGRVDTFDVVVMTQSCDLANDKVQEVILCPHWDLTEAGQMDPALAKSNAHKAILKGQSYRYTLLAASTIDELPMGIRIVDFGRIFTLPRSFVERFADAQGKRLRLCPPYREHLSQAFARFFMRVGLPQDIRLPG
ncbi:MAG: hypothetical protein K1X65_25170 [Caldilineales bacterium]|nr:hypothetical protein [Caldilineales bacterium]MCW5861039.1 hypothetical protein [Caldilineales bacterium]